MRELSIFVDESGSDGLSDRHYLLTVVMHDQSENIANSIAAYEGALRAKGLPDIPFHASPLMNGKDQYSGLGGVETAGDLMSLLVRLEDSFGIVPSADGTGLSLNPKAPHAPKAATAIELWAEKRAQLENGEIDADEYEDWKASL